VRLLEVLLPTMLTRRRRRLTAVAATGATLLAAFSLNLSNPVHAAPTPSEWRPVLVQDFDGPAGAPPDQDIWNHNLGGGGWGNSELQTYTDSTRNAATDGRGNLVITARRENPNNESCWYGPCTHTSARLLTKGTFTQRYGRIEARIKVPHGNGLWPAFWMLGEDFDQVGWPETGEIDIMEVIGREPNQAHGTIHGPGYSGGEGIGESYRLPGGAAFADDYHTFTIDWAPDSIKWYIDGNLYSTKTPADLGGDRWVFNKNFFLILNLAVGGNWPGPPDASTPFPAEMLVDYVATYQADEAQPPPPTTPPTTTPPTTPPTTTPPPTTPPTTTPPPTTVPPAPEPPTGGRDAYAPIEAEDADDQWGTQTQETSDAGGGLNVGWIADGDWLRFDDVDFGDEAPTQVLARVSSGAKRWVSGTVEVRLDSVDGPKLGDFSVGSTRGWQRWRTVPANVEGVTGTHDVYLRFRSGSGQDFVNVNWFRFAR
jgi:beta-glucanase (GH16 family)